MQKRYGVISNFYMIRVVLSETETLDLPTDCRWTMAEDIKTKTLENRILDWQWQVLFHSNESRWPYLQTIKTKWACML